jgi:tRNA-specific 2-thiouridylase
VDFIKSYIERNSGGSEISSNPGKILTKEGRELGRHQGTLKYTVGQRKGLGISSKNPLYVLKIEKENIFVGEKELLSTRRIYVRDINFHNISKKLFEGSLKHIPLWVQIRSTTPAVEASCTFEENHCAVEFKEAQYGVSPGQSAVMRESDSTIVCGGIIEVEEEFTTEQIVF